MAKPGFSYDPQCEYLAEHFLIEHPHRDYSRNVYDLAQHIQDAVEAWFAGRQPITAASAYDTLPCDSEPPNELILNDAGPVGDGRDE